MSTKPTLTKSKIVNQEGNYEIPNWFQDYIIIGLDKSCYNTDEIILKLQEPKLSHELKVWKLKTQEQEDVLLFSKKRVSTILDNESSFKHFVQLNYDNPEYQNKFVAFVNGSFADVDESESKLVEKIYNNIGNVEMFVGKVTLEEQEDIVDTPEELE